MVKLNKIINKICFNIAVENKDKCTFCKLIIDNDDKNRLYRSGLLKCNCKHTRGVKISFHIDTTKDIKLLKIAKVHQRNIVIEHMFKCKINCIHDEIGVKINDVIQLYLANAEIKGLKYIVIILYKYYII